MSTYKVVKYQPEYKLVWDAFVKHSKNATFLFHRDFMEYHQDRFEDYSLLVFKDDNVVALLPAHIKDSVVYSHKGLTYGGLLLSKKSKLLESFEIFKSLLEYLNTNECTRLEIKIIPPFYNQQPSDELEYFMYKAAAELVHRDALMIIDFYDKLPFQKNRREGINKAKRHGISIEIDNNYEGFWNEVLIPNLSKKHNASPVHTLDEIKLLASRFPKNIKQINAYKEGKIVAGTTLFLTETTIHPQYVSGNSEKNKLGSIDLLYDFMINHFSKGRRCFDFNISSEEAGKKLNKGLVFWKESCGARTIVANTYSVNTSVYKTLNLPLV